MWVGSCLPLNIDFFHKPVLHDKEQGAKENKHDPEYRQEVKRPTVADLKSQHKHAEQRDERGPDEFTFLLRRVDRLRVGIELMVRRGGVFAFAGTGNREAKIDRTVATNRLAARFAHANRIMCSVLITFHVCVPKVLPG